MHANSSASTWCLPTTRAGGSTPSGSPRWGCTSPTIGWTAGNSIRACPLVVDSGIQRLHNQGIAYLLANAPVSLGQAIGATDLPHRDARPRAATCWATSRSTKSGRMLKRGWANCTSGCSRTRSSERGQVPLGALRRTIGEWVEARGSGADARTSANTGAPRSPAPRQPLKARAFETCLSPLHSRGLDRLAPRHRRWYVVIMLESCHEASSVLVPAAPTASL